MGPAVAQVAVFVPLPSLEHSQEELSKARAARYHPTFQMKKLRPREEIAFQFPTRETLPSGLLLVPNAQNLVSVVQQHPKIPA